MALRQTSSNADDCINLKKEDHPSTEIVYLFDISKTFIDVFVAIKDPNPRSVSSLSMAVPSLSYCNNDDDPSKVEKIPDNTFGSKPVKSRYFNNGIAVKQQLPLPDLASGTLHLTCSNQ
jgi:hypothetical protein